MSEHYRILRPQPGCGTQTQGRNETAAEQGNCPHATFAHAYALASLSARFPETDPTTLVDEIIASISAAAAKMNEPKSDSLR